ncbi:MAG: MarR family transcriptional regulator [Acetobacteraceae bacterium]|nr:MAG: MarR family transcriptional regulator [Acetobacteraceae bacterium]
MRADQKRVAAAAEALEILHGHAMAQVFPRIAGEMHMRDMSFSQLIAIMHIFMNGPQTISEIARSVDLTHNAASRMVDRLVGAGLLSRKEDPQDRRQKKVELTDRGRAFPPALRQNTIDAYRQLLAQTDPALIDRLQSVIDDITPKLPPIPEPFYHGS